MPPFVTIVTDLRGQADLLRQRRYGVIEATEGRFRQIRLRPFPKVVSIAEVLLAGWLRQYRSGDRCLLFYDQPWRFPNFLTLKYLLSTRDTTYATCCRAVQALEEVARIKRSDAILATVANWRISRRLLARWGWEPHCGQAWRRHYIRRFYGDYPSQPAWLRAMAQPQIGDKAEDRASETPVISHAG